MDTEEVYKQVFESKLVSVIFE